MYSTLVNNEIFGTVSSHQNLTFKSVLLSSLRHPRLPLLKNITVWLSSLDPCTLGLCVFSFSDTLLVVLILFCWKDWRFSGCRVKRVVGGSCESCSMKFYMGLGSKVKRLFIQSPAKKQGLVGEVKDGGLGVESKMAGKSHDFGSKEESFFDSRPWLDSDAEDDFYSVNGEFTPSRGNTPNHQTSIRVTPNLNKALFINKFQQAKSESSSSATSPSGRKKLAELFQESFEGEQIINENTTEASTENGTPCSGSEATPSRVSKRKKERRARAMSCCLPSMVHSFSFNERRQKLSPASRSA